MEQCNSWCYNVVPMLHRWTNPHWPNVICWCCANVSYDVGPTSVQHFSASWEGVGRPLVPWLGISSRCFHPKQLAGHTAMVSTRRKFLPNLEAFIQSPLASPLYEAATHVKEMPFQPNCYATSSSVHHFIMSHQWNQTVKSVRKCPIRVKIDDFDNWRMSLKKYRALLLCCFKLCASFYNHQWNQNGVTVQKRPIQVKIDDCLTDDLEKQ